MMKRLTALLISLVLCLTAVAALAEEAPRFVTLKEWLDEKGPENCILTVKVDLMINPVLAAVSDETAGVNLFGLQMNGEFQDLMTADLHSGDILVLYNPKYNEYEGTIELADSTLLRKLHFEPRAAFFEALPDETVFVNDEEFYGDVFIDGNGQMVIFDNCAFHGNIILRASEGTRVMLCNTCKLDFTTTCKIESGVREADIYYSIPKYILEIPAIVESTDLGGVIIMGTDDIVFNGETYTANQSEHYETKDSGMVDFEEGMEILYHGVIRWWENNTEMRYTFAGNNI